MNFEFFYEIWPNPVEQWNQNFAAPTTTKKFYESVMGSCFNLQGRYRMIGGSLSVVSGLMILVATSWYANRIRLDHEAASLQALQGNANVNR